jgi:hypothetical protein
MTKRKREDSEHEQEATVQTGQDDTQDTENQAASVIQEGLAAGTEAMEDEGQESNQEAQEQTGQNDMEDEQEAAEGSEVEENEHSEEEDSDVEREMLPHVLPRTLREILDSEKYSPKIAYNIVKERIKEIKAEVVSLEAFGFLAERTKEEIDAPIAEFFGGSCSEDLNHLGDTINKKANQLQATFGDVYFNSRFVNKVLEFLPVEYFRKMSTAIQKDILAIYTLAVTN